MEIVTVLHTWSSGPVTLTSLAAASGAGLARHPLNQKESVVLRRGRAALLISRAKFLRFRPQDEPMEEEEPMNQ